MSTRRIMEAKLGKTIYSITFYEKVKRAVIPIGKDGDFILWSHLITIHYRFGVNMSKQQ
jgi:hypothetical protein